MTRPAFVRTGMPCRIVVFAAAAVIATSVGVPPVRAAGAIVVDTLTFGTAQDGACSISEAIAAANDDAIVMVGPGECAAGSGTDTITFSVDGAIILTASMPAITSDLTIDGNGTVTLDGAATYCPFVIGSGIVALKGLTIANGQATEGAPYEGGGIWNAGSLSLVDAVVTGNKADIGGGIYNAGTLSIVSSAVTDNEGGGPVGGGWGGGVYGGTISITGSMISGNYAGGSGGVGGDTVTIIESTVRDNGADMGGGVTGTSVTIIRSTIASNGVYEQGGGIAAKTVLVIDSTVTGNGAGDAGGGIYAADSVTAINSTISSNRVSLAEFQPGGGGIAATSIILRNTIVAGNTSPKAPEIAGTITSQVSSIVGLPAGLTLPDILDPGGLQDNGGPTQTIALTDSVRNAAREAADPAICAAKPVGGVDQRGEPRPATACDIGAFELPTPVTRSPFTDTADSTFRWDIEWLWASGITKGCTATKFCPIVTVTRGQMAAFLDRALDLPDTAVDYFTDDEASSFEANINRLAAASITKGCTATAYCPKDTVTRGQMAAFLDRALDPPATATDYFIDDETSTFENAINRLAAAGITKGCASRRFCPKDPVSRGQMAAFLYRALKTPAP